MNADNLAVGRAMCQSVIAGHIKSSLPDGSQLLEGGEAAAIMRAIREDKLYCFSRCGSLSLQNSQSKGMVSESARAPKPLTPFPDSQVGFGFPRPAVGRYSVVSQIWRGPYRVGQIHEDQGRIC